MLNLSHKRCLTLIPLNAIKLHTIYNRTHYIALGSGSTVQNIYNQKKHLNRPFQINHLNDIFVFSPVKPVDLSLMETEGVRLRSEKMWEAHVRGGDRPDRAKHFDLREFSSSFMVDIKNIECINLV